MQIGGGFDRVADEDDVAQILAIGQRIPNERVAFGGGHEHAHIAVAQDVIHLLGLEQRIERDERAAGGRGSE